MDTQAYKELEQMMSRPRTQNINTKIFVTILSIVIISVLIWYFFFKKDDDDDDDDLPDIQSEPSLTANEFLNCNIIKTNGITVDDFSILKTNPDILSTAFSKSCNDITPETVATIKDYIRMYNTDTYYWSNVEIPGKDQLYCGLFGKQVVKSTTNKKPIQIVLGCECEPVEIENGTFDTTTCDYTCNEGYEKWFDANGLKYTTTPDLTNNIPLNKLNAKKPPTEPYCIPKTGSTRPCPTEFDTTVYKRAFQTYTNEEWSNKCVARNVNDCQEGYNFQADGTCIKHTPLCKPGFSYKPGDPCYTSQSENTYDFSCTLDDCDITKCETRPPKMGRYSTMEGCLKAKSGAFDALQALQKKSEGDKKARLISDTKPCKVGKLSVTCGDVDPSDVYITSPDDNGLVGLYLMEGDIKKGCTAEEGFMCSSSTDISNPVNRFQVDNNNRLIYRGRDKRPPTGPKVCGYNTRLESISCPSSLGKDITVTII